jgi:hypothetical protein
MFNLTPGVLNKLDQKVWNLYPQPRKAGTRPVSQDGLEPFREPPGP